MKRKVREELWEKSERIWETEGREAHRGRWISPVMPADGRYSDGEFRRPCCVSREEEKRDEGGGAGAFYRRVLMEIKRAEWAGE
jgi:hypothetical protein